MNFNTRIALPSLLVILASCVEAPKFPLKPGEDYSVTTQSLSDCADVAEKFYPEDVRSYSGGGYSTPVRTNCVAGYGGSVSCSSYGGMYVAPYNYDVDVNLSKRLAIYHSCLEKKGYDLKLIKECSGDKLEIYNEIKNLGETKQGVYSSSTCSVTVGDELMIRW